MCLITVAPSGTSKNRGFIEDFIKSGMKSNTHGSGFAFKRHETSEIYLSKGYLTSNAIMDAIESHNIHVNDELIIHHRIGTSGLRNNFNMHPFVVTNDIATLKQTEGTFNLPVMAHNGIFGDFSDHNSDYNDTFLFIQHFMSSNQILDQLKDSVHGFQERFKSILGWQKLAFLFPDRPLILVGNFIEDDGYFHSNTGYITYTYDSGGSSSNSYPINKNKKKHNKNLIPDTLRTSNNRFELEDPEELGEPLACGVGYRGVIIPFKGGTQNQYPHQSQPLDGSDDDIYDEKTDSIVNKQFCRINKNQQSIKFSGRIININKNNFNHFIAIPNIDIQSNNLNGNSILKHKNGYYFEDYDEKTELNFLVQTKEPNEMFYLNYKEHASDFTLYVKHEFKDKYKSLNEFINQNNVVFTKSMFKKVSKAISVNSRNEYINFKGYGYIYKNDLQHLMNLNASFIAAENINASRKRVADKLIHDSVEWTEDDTIKIVRRTDIKM